MRGREASGDTLEFRLRFFPGLAIALLNKSDHLLRVAFRFLYLVVCEIAVLLTKLTLEFGPVTLDLIPVHLSLLDFMLQTQNAPSTAWVPSDHPGEFACEKFLDIVDGMVGEDLRDVEHDPGGNLLMHLVPDLAENVPACDQHEVIEGAVMGRRVQPFGKIGGEALLLELVPIGILYSRALRRRPVIESPRAVRGPFACLRILVFFTASDDEIHVLLVADVDHEKRLLSVSHHDPCALRQTGSTHPCPPLRRIS